MTGCLVVVFVGIPLIVALTLEALHGPAVIVAVYAFMVLVWGWRE